MIVPAFVGNTETDRNDIQKGWFRQDNTFGAQIVAGMEDEFVLPFLKLSPISSGPPSTRPSLLVVTVFSFSRVSPSSR